MVRNEPSIAHFSFSHPVWQLPYVSNFHTVLLEATLRGAFLVPATGLEPVRFLRRGILSYFSYLEPSGTYRILEEHINP